MTSAREDAMNEQQEPGTRTPESSEPEPDFEKALAELEALVEKLEKGEISLDESMQHFKRGVELTRRCQSVLDKAQQIVEQLTNPDDESTAVPIESTD